MTITLDKKYRTRDGRDVELKFVDGREPEPVAGYVDGLDLIRSWKPSGAYFQNITCGLDLIEVRPSAEEVVRGVLDSCFDIDLTQGARAIGSERIVSALREDGYLEGEGDE